MNLIPEAETNLSRLQADAKSHRDGAGNARFNKQLCSFVTLNLVRKELQSSFQVSIYRLCHLNIQN